MALAGLAIGAVLGEAHLEMRSLDPPLPTAEDLGAIGAPHRDGPVRIRFVNTSTQRTPEERDGAHPGFLLEWTDGRALLIDVGMERAAALEFGKPLEWLGAAPPVAHGSVGEQLGPAAVAIRAVAFTHLHHDHTGGMAELCEAAGHELPVLQTPEQHDRLNFGTRLGLDALEAASCERRVRIGDGEGRSHHPLPGFPGVYAIPAAGHTPGSTIYAARVGATLWILSGDVTNSKPNLLRDVPKPLAYSLLIVPEHRERLGRLRRWLAGLDGAPDTVVLPSHDGTAIVESGMEAWAAAG